MNIDEIPSAVSWAEAVPANISYATRAVINRRADEWMLGRSTGTPPAFLNSKQRKERAKRLAACQKSG